MLTITSERLRAVATAIFTGLGTPRDIADDTVEILIASNLAGHDSHGVQLIPNYARLVEEGRVAPAARPEILEESATTALVAGRWGWGQHTAAWGDSLVEEKTAAEKARGSRRRRF